MAEEIFTEKCLLCPRYCKTNRTISIGFCGGGNHIKVAKAVLHHWEEPCISGEYGSGAVFFSGCQLKCCFCQNYRISIENYGKEVSIERLAEIFLELQDKKAHNINLVSPTPYIPWIIKSLDLVKNKLHIPVVFNSGGYENIETLKMLNGYIDIYLPDLKYMDTLISKKYSVAENYFQFASKAIAEMYKQVGRNQFDEKGILKKGLIIRHLILPNNRIDSTNILQWIKNNFNTDDILVSLMSQYTPSDKDKLHKEINRGISTYEYNKVVDKAISLGINGYMQDKSSIGNKYTPEFDLAGV